MSSTTTDRRLGLTGSAAIKVPCKAATTANITLSAAQTIDGVSCVSGDRVLVKSQTSSVDNGIYVVDTGTWTRDLDFDGVADVVTGTIVMVLNGSTNANTYWRLATTGTVTFGTSAITFAAALAGDSAMVTFLPSGIGAAARTVQAKDREIVSVTDYFANGVSGALVDPTGVTESAGGFQAAVNASLNVFIPPGTYRIGSTITTRAGQNIFGSGANNALLQRATDTSFAIFTLPVNKDGQAFSNFKVQESASTLTNTGVYFSVACNDVAFRNIWTLYGWQQYSLVAGSSDIVWDADCIFETSRKGAIISDSSGRNSVRGYFWKNSSDSSNPADRGYAIRLQKNAGYTFGSFNWEIKARFAENVYGPFISSSSSNGVLIDSILEICSQVDNGQKSDIELLNDTNIVIRGVSNSVVNSYAAGQRGSKYVVDIGAGCSNITIDPSAFQAGVTGTINDPNNTAIVYGVPGYNDANAISLPVQVNGSGTGITMSAQTGTLNKSGRVVTFNASTTLTSKGAGSGTVRLGPLPFTPAATCYSSGLITSTAGITGPIYFQLNADGYVYPLFAISTNVADTNIANNSIFLFSGTYQV